MHQPSLPRRRPATTRRARSFALLWFLLLWLALLAGCGEDSGQRTAREELEAYVGTLPDAAGYDLAEANCTDNARTFLTAVDTDVFICAVRRVEGGCDWFRVDFRRARAEVRRTDRDAGCVLPE